MPANRKVLLFAVISLCFIFGNARNSFAGQNKRETLKGRQIVFKYGCIKCHSFIKGARIDGIISLAGWGDKHLSLRQTEKAIRNCKADIYCSRILSGKQVKYAAYFLNSLKEKKNNGQ